MADGLKRVEIRSTVDQEIAEVTREALEHDVPAFDSTPIWDKLVRKDIAAIPRVIPQPLPPALWTWFEASAHGQRFGALIARRQLASLIPDGEKEDIYASAVRRAKADEAEVLINTQHWIDASGAAKYCGMSFYWCSEGGAVEGTFHLVCRPEQTADQMLAQRIEMQAAIALDHVELLRMEHRKDGTDPAHGSRIPSLVA